jgi:hypothetical protein
MCAMCFVPTVSSAHSFGTPFVLPIPFWIYVYGCAATLIVTFAVLGIFASGPVSSASARRLEFNVNTLTYAAGRWVFWVLRAGAAGCLILTVLAGLIGGADEGNYIGMVLFWVVFLLGFTYLTLILGDLYAYINPWKLFVEWLDKIGVNFSISRLPYPESFGYWPAFLFYLALIWIELFVKPDPSSLSILLIIYSATTFIGVTLFGKAIWFSRADFFSVFFNLVGKLAPLEYVDGRGDLPQKVRFRLPFAGALNERPAHISLVLFVLFMLSSTVYDGIYDTQLWTAFFWRSALWLLQPIWGADLGKAQGMLVGAFRVYRKVGLLAFPFLYLGFYILALWGAKVLTRATIPLRTLAFDFCYSLLPIAVAYHFTHYYTFLIVEIGNLPSMLTDPFGLGWNLFGLQENLQSPALKMGVIWHTQVFVILLGHLVGVVLAHNVAARTFPTRRQIVVSQLPLLLLMVVYTLIGLWILTLPLGAG